MVSIEEARDRLEERILGLDEVTGIATRNDRFIVSVSTRDIARQLTQRLPQIAGYNVEYRVVQGTPQPQPAKTTDKQNPE